MTPRNPALSALAPAVATPLPRVLRPQRAVPADAVRPTRAEVNLANLRHNLRVVQRLSAGRPVWSVLKADGYGHGAKAVARTLERAGASGMCVALLEEGIELRDAGIKIPILVTGGYYGRAWGELLRHDLTPVLHDPGQVEIGTLAQARHRIRIIAGATIAIGIASILAGVALHFGLIRPRRSEER